MYSVSTYRIVSLFTAIACASALASGCARPQTFADPSAQLYQPPVVSPGVDSSGSAAPLYDNGSGSYGSGYAPPGQSYNYGAQAPAADPGYSQAEMKAMYEKYYGSGQSTITPNTNPPATSPGGTSYPGGSTQAGGGESVTTQRPESPQNPIDDSISALRNNDKASGGSQSSGSGTSPSNGQARPMVPIQRGLGGAGEFGDNRSTSLQGSPAQGPLNGSANPQRSTDLSGATAGTENRNPNSGATSNGWPYSLAPGGNYPRQRVPLDSAHGTSTADNSTPGNPASTGNGPAPESTAGTSGAEQATPRLQPPASPVSSGPAESNYPPNGSWPQKPIPLPRDSS